MSDSTSIEWADTTWNPVLGCDRVSPGCDNCLAPETKVLRADMTWVPIDQLKVGDQLVSFTDKPAIGQNRVWEEATVEAAWETFKPTVTVELANGAKFTASEDHLWLIARRGASQWWRKTIGLNFKTEVRALQCSPTHTDLDDYRAGYIAGATEGDGTFRWDPSWRSSSMGFPQSYWRVAKPEQDVDVLDRLVEYLDHFGVTVAVRSFDAGESAFTDDPMPMAKVETRRRDHLALITGLCQERTSREWMTGWLAGMFDTDASYSGGSLRYCQKKPNDILDRVERYGKELGFHLKSEHYEGNNCPTVRLMGGIAENIAFLSSISPALVRRCRDFYGKRIETPTSPVVGIRRGPAQRLIDITTSTGTFVAEGALTHNCYAITQAHIRARNPHPRVATAFAGLTERTSDSLDWTGRINLLPERLTQPFSWRNPRKVFVNSLADLFHEDVPNGFIARVWAAMALSPRHTFQLLTKRHGRMRALLNSSDFRFACEAAQAELIQSDTIPEYRRREFQKQWWSDFAEPLRNVWLGVSVEDQKRADLRIPALLDTPAAVRWISAEPLLGPLYEMDGYFRNDVYRCTCGAWEKEGAGFPQCAECGRTWKHQPGTRLDWVVVGGESGPGARPMHPEWARTLRDQCAAAGVPFFFKQWGEWGPAPWSVRIPEPEGGWEAADPDWLAAEKVKAEQRGATHDVRPSGHLYKPDHKTWSVERDPDGHYPGAVRRWGKKHAGRVLDGRTWDQFPDTRTAVA